MISTLPDTVTYPESDGAPLGENTLQVQWIISLFSNLSALFAARDDVFIAADLFWYPVQGDPQVVTAPDVMLVFGRPKGHRRSYRMWEEDDVPVHVVFEILSPGNRVLEMKRKFEFYQRHGVKEYYVYDPDENELEIWERKRGKLTYVKNPNGHTSPLMGIRFELSQDELTIHSPDGTPFTTLEAMRQKYFDELDRAELERKRAEQHKAKSAAMAAKLRELGVDPDQLC